MKFNTWLDKDPSSSHAMFVFITNIHSKEALGRYYGWIKYPGEPPRFFSDFPDPDSFTKNPKEVEVKLKPHHRTKMIEEIFSLDV